MSWSVLSGAIRLRLPLAVMAMALEATHSSLRREEDDPPSSSPPELESRISCLNTSRTAVTKRLRQRSAGNRSRLRCRRRWRSQFVIVLRGRPVVLCRRSGCRLHAGIIGEHGRQIVDPDGGTAKTVFLKLTARQCSHEIVRNFILWHGSLVFNRKRGTHAHRGPQAARYF